MLQMEVSATPSSHQRRQFARSATICLNRPARGGRRRCAVTRLTQDREQNRSIHSQSRLLNLPAAVDGAERRPIAGAGGVRLPEPDRAVGVAPENVGGAVVVEIADA